MAQQITYTGPLTAVTTPDGTLFTRGVPVEVSDDLATSLLLQSFTPVAAAPAPVTTAPAPAPAPTPAPAPATSFTAAPAVQTVTTAPAPTDTGTVLSPVTGVTS